MNVRNPHRAVWMVSLLIAAQALAQASAARKRLPRLTAKPPSAQATTKLRAFQQRLRGAQVLWDQDTKLPARVFGLQQKVAPSTSAGTVDRVARGFMRSNLNFLGIDPTALQRRMTIERRGRSMVKYRQVHDGVPVEGAEAGCVVTSDGRLLQYASNCADLANFPTAARFPRNGAIQLARRALGRLGPTAAIDGIQKVIIRQRNARGQLQHRLVYKIHAATNVTNEQRYKELVFDANTGRVVRMGDRFPTTITGTVRAEVYPTRSTDPSQTLPLGRLSVTIRRPGATSAWLIPTLSDGSYRLGAGPGAWQLNAALSGGYAGVTGLVNTDVGHSADVDNGDVHNWDWTAANGDDVEQLNVFYHINRLHNEFYRDHLDYRWVNDWTGRSQFVAVTGLDWNNAHAGSPMEFGRGTWALNAEVVYHECTHNVIHTLFGSAYVGFVSGDAVANSHEAYAFDEGFSDYMACTFLNWSTHGRRNLRNRMQYPDEYDTETGQGLEGHSGGQIIAGAAWDLRRLMRARLGDEAGTSACDHLVFDSLATLAAYPRPYRFSYPGTSNFLTAMLLTDDWDGNLENGTPNGRDILQAFRRHGMLPVDVWIRDRVEDRGNVPSNPGGEPFWISNDIHFYEPRGWREVPSGLTTMVEVVLWNRGYLEAEDTRVDLYEADPAEGLSWPRDWTHVGTSTSTRMRAGGQGYTSPRIAWRPRRGGEYALMARLTHEQDPIMEPHDVADENNVAMCNVAVVPYLPGDMFEVRYRPRLDEHWDKLRRAVEIMTERFPPETPIDLDWVDPRTNRPIASQPRFATRTTRIRPTRLEFHRSTRLAQPTSAAAARQPDARMRKEAARAMADLSRNVKRITKPRTAAKAPVASGPSNAPRNVQVTTCLFAPAQRAPNAKLKLSFRVPQNAKPGEQYVVHVMEREAGKVVAGMTYVVQVKR